jgi:hypothetical protein
MVLELPLQKDFKRRGESHNLGIASLSKRVRSMRYFSVQIKF